MALNIELNVKNLFLLLFIGLLLIGFYILGKDFILEKISKEVISKPVKKIEIDFQFLESSLLKELQPMEKIPPLEIQIGRENPFLPY